MFQGKVDEIFKEFLNAFGIADDMLVVQYNRDGTGHDGTLENNAEHVQKRKLKLLLLILSCILLYNDRYIDKCYFRCTNISSFGEIVSRAQLQPAHENYMC